MKDADAVIALSDQCFGKGYFNLDFIEACIRAKQWHVFLAEDNSGICGYVLLLTGDYPEILEEIGKEHRGVLGFLEGEKQICLRKSTCVACSHRRKGLGTSLASHAIQVFPNHLHISISWKRSTAVPMLDISKKLGFRDSVVLKNYWYSDSTVKGYTCPECGQPPCKCSAHLLVRS